MGKPAARIGDRVQGICHHGRDDCPHPWSGTIVAGSDTVLTDGKPVARIGDNIATSCPHCGRATIVGGSDSVLAQKPIAHIGDRVVSPGGQGTIVGSGETVIVA